MKVETMHWPARSASGAGVLVWILQKLSQGTGILAGWYERGRQRRQLTRLDERLLRDIGISRVDALQEAGKPFWRE